MKRKWLGLVYGVATISLLSACSGSSEFGSESDQFASTDESTLTVWAWDKNFKYSNHGTCWRVLQGRRS